MTREICEGYRVVRGLKRREVKEGIARLREEWVNKRGLNREVRELSIEMEKWEG